MSLAACPSKVAAAVRAPRSSRCASQVVSAFPKPQEVFKGAATVAASLILSGAASALTFDEIQGLTYKQVKGSGIANTCPVLESGSSDPRTLKEGTYELAQFCMEPTSFRVKEESQFKGGETDFVKTTLVTRLTYTLGDMTGTFKIDKNGNMQMTEEDGMDYAAVTVQMPGGERVPFLFSIKELNAKGNADGLQGNFKVPAYRGSTFQDPRGRGGSTGYDTAVGLAASGDDDQYMRENLKRNESNIGDAVFSIAKVDAVTGEVAGVFETLQPSDDDMGAKEPKDVKIRGIWYAQLQQ